MDTENLSEWNLEEEIERNPSLKLTDVTSLRAHCASLLSSSASGSGIQASDQLMVAILHSNNYHLSIAQTSATKYYEVRSFSPEVFQDRDVHQDEVQSGLDAVYFCPLPRKTPEGYRIVLQKMRKADPLAFHHINAAKFELLVLDSLCYQEPSCPGYLIFYDMRNVTMAHILKSNIFLTRKLLTYIQDGIPLKIRRIALIYAGELSEKIMFFMKPFLSKRMLNLIKVYFTNQMEELWETLPMEYWPQDYGGDLPAIETLHQSQIEWLKKIQPKLDSYISVPTRRPNANTSVTSE